MANNKELLQELEQTLKRLHPSVVQKLKEGLPASEIDKIASSAQLTFTDEIYDLFGWKNGMQNKSGNSSAQLLLFPNGIPYSLIEAADTYDLLSVTKHYFEPNYFPLFSDGNDDILLIDLDQDSSTYIMISLYSPSQFGNNNLITIYDSLSGLLQTAIACYDQKAYWIDQGGLAVDSDAHYNIASNLNPNSQYWQYM